MDKLYHTYNQAFWVFKKKKILVEYKGKSQIGQIIYTKKQTNEKKKGNQ